MNIIRNKKVIAIIVAGGIGKRFSNKIPKQYLEINNCSIIRHTILRFLAHSEIDHVQVIINKKHTKISRNSLKGLNILPVVYGGKNRQESVLKGLKAIKKLNPQKVLVHDAARPNISKELISLIIKNIKTQPQPYDPWDWKRDEKGSVPDDIKIQSSRPVRKKIY